MAIDAIDRESLKEFLLSGGVEPGKADICMKEFEPFYLKAESGRHDLAKEEDVDVEEVKKSLKLATGRRVVNVVFVSVSGTTERPEWLTEKAVHYGFEFSLMHSLQNWFGENRFQRAGPNPSRRRFDRCFWSDYQDLATGIATGELWGLMCDVEANLWTSLCYLLDFTLGDDQMQIDRITPLIRILPRAMPLCEMADEPGTWLVLVA